MKRRNFLRTCFLAPFVVLFKKKTRSGTKLISDIPLNSETCVSEVPDLPMRDWVHAQFNPVIDLQLNEPFEGKVVGMCEFQGNLWIASEKGVYRIKNYET